MNDTLWRVKLSTLASTWNLFQWRSQEVSISPRQILPRFVNPHSMQLYYNTKSHIQPLMIASHRNKFRCQPARRTNDSVRRLKRKRILTMASVLWARNAVDLRILQLRVWSRTSKIWEPRWLRCWIKLSDPSERWEGSISLILSQILGVSRDRILWISKHDAVRWVGWRLLPQVRAQEEQLRKPIELRRASFAPLGLSKSKQTNVGQHLEFIPVAKPRGLQSPR
jgi:hypothetical protein